MDCRYVDTGRFSSVGKAWLGLVNTMFRVTAGCGFESPAGQLKITNCLSDETLNRGPV